MDHLVSEATYPAEVQAQIRSRGAYAVDIANRWMLGWPGQVRRLIASGEYLEVLEHQMRQEVDLLTGPNAPSHLARHEIVELYGLSLGPPTG